MRRDMTGNICLVWTMVAVSVVTCLGAVTVVAAGHNHSTPQQVFDAMRGSFQPAKAKGVHARYQWDLSGPNGGEWRIDPLGLMCAVEVKIALHGAARTNAQFEVFDAGISHLHPGPVLAVLKHRVMQI